MTRESLGLIALQTSALFLAIWGIFRLFPTIPVNSKAWIWRLAFLKPLLSLMPFAVVTLHVLPASVVSSQPAMVPDSNIVVPVSSPAAAISEPSLSITNSIDPVMTLWMLGVVGVGLYGIWGFVRALQIVRHSEPVVRTDLQERLVELMDKAKVEPPVQLLASPLVRSAMLVGGPRPAIVLPSAEVANGSLADLHLMLAHEVAHLSRRDLTWFGVTSTVQALFFFNPVVWLAAKCSRLDHESATDRYAAQLAGVPIQTYAEMLLRATVVARGSLAAGTLPMAASYRTIHRRLEAMKHFHLTPSPWRKSAIAALALVTCGLLPTYQIAEAQGVVPPAKKQATKKSSAKVIKPATSKEKPGNYKVWMKGKDGKKAWVTNDKSDKIALYAWNGKKYVLLKHVTRAEFEKERAKLLKESAKLGEKPGAQKAPAHVPPKSKHDDHKAPLGEGVGVVAPGQGHGVGISGQHEHGGAPSHQPGQHSSGNISMKFQDQDVQGALHAILKQVVRHYVIAPEVKGKLTLEMNNVNLETALDMIVRQVDGRWFVQDGVYHVTAKGAQTAHLPRSGQQVAVKISKLEMRDTDVSGAITTIANQAKLTFAIDPKLQGKINCVLENVTFEEALAAILEQVQGTYRIEDGVWTFLPKS